MMPPLRFDDLMHDMLVSAATEQPPIRFGRNASSPRLTEHADGFTLTLAVPGVARSDLKVTVHDRMVKISGETSTNTHTHFASFSHTLPKTADGEQATASAADGILTITIPKKAPVASQALTRIVEVETEVMDASSDSDDDDHSYALTLPAPGVAASDLAITIDKDRVLNVRGETKRTGAFVRQAFRLPRDADVDGTTASHVDGMVTLKVPKQAAPVPVTIPVRNASALASTTQADHATETETEGAVAPPSTPTAKGAAEEEAAAPAATGPADVEMA